MTITIGEENPPIPHSLRLRGWPSMQSDPNIRNLGGSGVGYPPTRAEDTVQSTQSYIFPLTLEILEGTS